MTIEQIVEDLKSLLLKEFENDPVYRLAILNKLEDSLFSEEIISMHHEISYSTVEAGKIIGRADSTIRNHFRSDLYDYINPEKYGKYYRLNYKSVFKLHMIFLLLEKAGKTTVDILVELGVQPSVTLGNSSRLSENERVGMQQINHNENGAFENRLEDLEKNFKIQTIMLNLLKYEKDLSDIERKIDITEREIKQIRMDAYMKYLEEKQAQLLTTSLKKSIQKPSFFGFFKKVDELDISKIENEIAIALKGKMKSNIEQKVNHFEEELIKYKEKENNLKEILTIEKKKFLELSSGTSADINLLEYYTE